MHGQILESVNAAKYLGVTICKNLSWNSHIDNITTKANRTLGFVKRNIQTKNKDIRTMAYNTLVRPQVEYASAVCSPHTKENNKKIEFVQRRAARWVSDEYSMQSSVKAMLGNLGSVSPSPKKGHGKVAKKGHFLTCGNMSKGHF